MYVYGCLQCVMWRKHPEVNTVLLFCTSLSPLQLRGYCPHLPEVVSAAVKVIQETSSNVYSIRFLVEGFFAHFFSPYRRGYHTEDIQWFLEFANKQEQWGASYAQHQVHEHHEQQVNTTEVGHLCATQIRMLWI